MLITLLLIPFLSIFQVYCLEEPSPEIFLQPRNFNPHPYKLRYNLRTGDRKASRLGNYASQIDTFGTSAASDDRGPILFPENAQSADNQITTNRFIVDQLKDNHPYASVAAKKKKKYGLPDRVNLQVYKALADHGAKVLNVPRADDLKDIPNYVEDYDYNDQSKKNYAFSYKVVDHLTGDDFSHSQSQDSQATNGEYRVKLPDGRVQIVSYTADKNGYKADVKYSGRKHTAAAVVGSGPQHVYTTPAHQHLSPAAPVHVPLYADSALLKSHAHDFINQHLITAEHKPEYYAARHDDGVVFILSDKYRAPAEKLQLLPNTRSTQQKAHDAEKFIAPYTALSTLASNLDKFKPVYINAPKYKLPTTIH